MEIANGAWGGLLIAVRLLPLALCLPASMTRALPRGSRLAIVLMLAVVLVPILPVSPSGSTLAGQSLLAAVFRELVLGLALALGFVMLFAGLTMAGAILSPMTGVVWADVADPLGNTNASSAVERFFAAWALTLFWATNGHRHVLRAILECFDRMPVGAVWEQTGMPSHVSEMLMHSSRLGLQAAAPIAFCLIAATFAIALMGRSLSFWGVAGLGTAVSWTVLLVVTCVFLPSLSDIYQQQFVAGLDVMQTWFERGSSLSHVPGK